MKGTIFAVALNHRSQLDAWREAFQNAAEDRGLVYQTAQHRYRRWREHSLPARRNRAEWRHRGADRR